MDNYISDEEADQHWMELMSIITPRDQTQVDQCAREYVRLVHERNDRLTKSIMEAIMWLSIQQTDRALQTLNQAITS